MPESVLPTHEALLQLCAKAAPNPWYPRAYAEESGVHRDSLDAPLNDLRLAGFVRLTEWEPGRGQGYVLTQSGKTALYNPVAISQLRGEHRTSALPAEESPQPRPESRRTLTTFERGERARKSLYEPTPSRVVPILLLLNFLAFGWSFYLAMRAGVPAAEFASGAGRGLSVAMREAGALTARDLVHGEWWRLLTCAFLHFGLLHLALNMYCLYSLRFLESIWGPTRFLILYFSSAIGCSSIAMLYYNPLEPVLMAGASGAIWGMMASLFAWLFMNRSHLPPREYTAWVQQMSVIFLINVGVSFMPGVGAVGHFAGGIVGFVMATLLHVQRFAVGPRKLAATVLLVMLPILCLYALAAKMKADDRWQQLAAGDRLQQRILKAAAFQQQVVPTVDRADMAAEKALPEAYVLTDQAPARRKPEKVRSVRDQLKAAYDQVQEATNKLGDKAPDENLTGVYDAAKALLATHAALLQRLDQLLVSEASWGPDERVEFEARRKRAAKNWLDAKNDF